MVFTTNVFHTILVSCFFWGSPFFAFRFGAPVPPMISALQLPSEEDKRSGRNFARAGRAHQRNFLRFGKRTPLTFGLGIEGDSSEEIYGIPNIEKFIRYLF